MRVVAALHLVLPLLVQLLVRDRQPEMEPVVFLRLVIRVELYRQSETNIHILVALIPLVELGRPVLLLSGVPQRETAHGEFLL